MPLVKKIIKYSGMLILCGWMFFIGLLVGRGTAPVGFDTGWFQERLAVIFEDSQIEEPVLEKPDLDFYTALQKSDLKEDYDLKFNKSDISAKGENGKLSEFLEGESSEAAKIDHNAPMKKSVKAMTSKQSGKKSISESSREDNIYQKTMQTINSIASIAKSDKTKTSEQLGQNKITTPSETSKTKNLDKSIQTKTASLPAKSKTSSHLVESKSSAESASSEGLVKLPEKKSEQTKENNTQGYTYTIQIASFNTEADAMNYIAKLGAQGYSAYKSSGMVGDKTWYRIRTGNFNNITDAKESLKKLESNGINGLIIQKD